jgi:hypothetical protein
MRATISLKRDRIKLKGSGRKTISGRSGSKGRKTLGQDMR